MAGSIVWSYKSVPIKQHLTGTYIGALFRLYLSEHSVVYIQCPHLANGVNNDATITIQTLQTNLKNLREFTDKIMLDRGYIQIVLGILTCLPYWGVQLDSE